MTLTHLVEHGRLIYTGPTPTNVLEAFNISLNKWYTLAVLEDYRDFKACGGFDTCGLCMLYHHTLSCVECPIRLDAENTTKGHNCYANTYFQAFYDELDSGDPPDPEVLRDLARQEYLFILGLARKTLPKDYFPNLLEQVTPLEQAP